MTRALLIILNVFFLVNVAWAQLYVEKLGKDINTSRYDEICPVLSDDNTKMYFTRVADPGFNKTLMQASVNQNENLNYIKYYRLLSEIYTEMSGSTVKSPIESDFNQDIWIAEKSGPTFKNVYHPSWPLNDALPNSVCSVFPEENALIVINQLRGDGGLKEGFSYIKINDDGTYQSPLPLNIYKFYEEGNSVNLSMSRDSEHLFLALKRKDGQGDFDIYLCIRVSKNLWSKPFLLQKGINSPYRETTPFISKDKKRLYFASNRGNVNGQTDIYVSERLDYTYLNWSEPKKLPSPVNTEFSESQPFLDLEEKYLYFTSTRDGTSDIFRAELEPSAVLSQPLTINLRIIKAEDDYTTRGELRWGAAHKDQFEGFFRTYTGIHQIVVSKDEPIRIQARKRGYVSEEVVINPRELIEAGTLIHELDIYIHKGKQIVVRDNLPLFGTKRKVTLRKIYFEKGKAVVLPSSQLQLEKLIRVMKDNPGLYISIEGHTDNVGSKKDLLDLSYDRANAIKRYLMNRHINPVRIATVGFGDERPLNNNLTEEDREKNRRVEVRIIKE